MRSKRLAAAALAALALAVAPALVSAADRATEPTSDVKASAQSVAVSQFASMKDVKAAPLSARELGAIKGQHVHFITISNGKLHFAGDVKTENNWSNEWGGTDGQPVAPSYKGLCIAHGNGSIFIPTGPPGSGAPITLQCPAGS